MPRAGPFPASTRTQGWRESRGRKLSLESCNQLGDGLLSSFVLFGFYFFCPGVGWQLWSSFGILDFFSLFVSGLRHYPKKKKKKNQLSKGTLKPKPNHLKCLASTEEKKNSEPKSLHLFNTSQDSTPKCILCKNKQ